MNIEEMIELNREGMTLTQIAKKVSLPVSSISRRFKKVGIKPQLNTGQKRKIIKLLKAGIPAKKIASQLGLTRQYISIIKLEIQDSE